MLILTMMALKLIFTLLILNLSCNVNKHESTVVCEHYFDKRQNIEIYSKVEKVPIYPKGIGFILNDFTRKFRLLPNEVIQASFYFELLIDKNGKLIDVYILNKHENEYSNYERNAINVIKEYSYWHPAKCNGISVPFKMVLPIKI